jgi:hypothetical protein
LIPNLSPNANAYPSIHRFRSGHVTTQSRKINANSPFAERKQTADRKLFCRILLKKPSFFWTDFFIKLGPQIRLLPVPNFGVNTKLYEIVVPTLYGTSKSNFVPDRLTFQIARTTISPNYPGEMFEISDRAVLVVSADVPPQAGEPDEQCIQRENANAARATIHHQEVDAATTIASQPTDNVVQGAGDQPGGNVFNGAQLPMAPAAPQQ